MPTAEQMVGMAAGTQTPMNIKVDAGLNPQKAQQGGANLLAQVIGQLTGGNLVHVDSTAPSATSGAVNVNENF